MQGSPFPRVVGVIHMPPMITFRGDALGLRFRELEHFLERLPEHAGDAKGHLQRGRLLLPLDRVHGLTRYTNAVGGLSLLPATQRLPFFRQSHLKPAC